MDRRGFLKSIVLMGVAVLVPVKLFDSLTKGHNFPPSSKNTKCAWELGSPCQGSVFSASVFSGQLTVPICENHLVGHRVIMSLHAAGQDVEQFLQLSEKERLALIERTGASLVPWDQI